MNVYDPKPPFIFKIIGFFMALIWIASLGLFAWIVYVAVVCCISPEDVGSFFGRIANGFQRELQ